MNPEPIGSFFQLFGPAHSRVAALIRGLGTVTRNRQAAPLIAPLATALAQEEVLFQLPVQALKIILSSIGSELNEYEQPDTIRPATLQVGIGRLGGTYVRLKDAPEHLFLIGDQLHTSGSALNPRDGRYLAHAEESALLGDGDHETPESFVATLYLAVQRLLNSGAMTAEPEGPVTVRHNGREWVPCPADQAEGTVEMGVVKPIVTQSVRMTEESGKTVVIGTMSDGREVELIRFYADELHFSSEDFIGLSRCGAQDLFHHRDVAYLQR